MACKNEKKKLTFEDKWWRAYTKNAGRRQHRSDKKYCTRFMRNFSKKICKKALTDPTEQCIINNVRSRKATRRVRSQVDRVSPFKRNEHLENNAGQEASKPLQKNKKI